MRLWCAMVLAAVGTIAVAEDGRPISYEDLVGIVDLGIPSFRQSEGIAVSPDGLAVAIEARRADLATNKVVTRWLVVPLPKAGRSIGGRSIGALDVGDGGDAISSTSYGMTLGHTAPQIPVWILDSSAFVYRLKRNEEIQLWRSWRDGRPQEQLTHNEGDVDSFRIALDGRRIFVVAGVPRSKLRMARAEESQRGFRYDDRFIPFYSKYPVPSPELEATTSERLWVYDLKERSERRATESEKSEYAELANKANEQFRYRTPKRAEQGATRVWLEDRRENRELGINPPLTVVANRAPTKRILVCPARSCTGRFLGLWVNDSGSTAYFLRWSGEYDYGPVGLYSWKIGTSHVREILSTEALLQGCTRIGEELVCGHESATMPAQLSVINLSTGTIRSLFNANPKFRQIRFGSVRPMKWRAPDGSEGFGHAVYPVGYEPGKRYPLVIVQYRSRGFLRGGVGDEYPIHMFAEKGFVVLSFHRPDDWDIQAQASTDEEANRKSFAEQRSRWRVLSSLLAGIDELDRAGLIDPQRVGITGMSDGGETAAFALIHAPDRFAAAAVSWTWWNPIQFHLLGPKIQSLFRSYGMENPDHQTNAANWRALSVALNASKVRSPILLQVSDSEFLGETQVFTALRDLGKPVDMYVFPDEFHTKSQPRHRLSIYRRSTEWLEFWLMGVEEDPPMDSEQYRHWRALREEWSNVKEPLNLSSTAVTE